MSSILGLINTESFSSDRFKNYRRTVFYYYPQGAAPLTGLLSLMREETTNDPQFFWYEKRKQDQRLASAAISTTIAYYATGITVTAAGKISAATIAAANFSWTVDTQYAIKTAANPENIYRIGHIVKMVATNTSAASVDILGRINAINTASDSPANVIGLISIGTVANIDYDASGNVGVDINVVGSAFAEGSVGSSNNVYTTPVNPSNYTQIFRTAYQITGTALKTSAKYDARGVFPDEAKEAMLNHSTEMEKGFLWGQKNQNSVTSGGVTTITRTTGGFMYYLTLWEAGSTYGNTAATTDTDDTKRIIINSPGRLVFKTFLGYMERVWRMTNNKTAEKLAFVGSGALNILTQMFASKVVQMQKPPAGEVYGMELVKIILPMGTLYLKSHPLFSENPIWRSAMLIIDVPNLRYRYLNDRDTELLRDRQPNNADYIEHEYLTECGLEVNFPESGMYIQNILDWEP